MTANVKVGGSTAMNPRIPDVWTLPCPAINGAAQHWPQQFEQRRHKGPEVVTICGHCRSTWAALDAEARR